MGYQVYKVGQRWGGGAAGRPGMTAQIFERVSGDSGPDIVKILPGTGSLTDVPRNGFVTRERGWYVFTAMVRILGNPGAFTQLGVRFLRANQATGEGRHYEGAGEYLGTELAYNAMEIIPCNAGDLVQTQMTFGPTGNSGTVNLGVRSGMLQIRKLDV